MNVYNNIQNGFGIFAGYSASVYKRATPKPVIFNVDPSSGKPGDHIIITGENFIASPQQYTTVAFAGQQFSIRGEIIQLSSTQIEVIVPDQAVTGKIIYQNGRVAVSESEFIIY